MSDSPWPHEPQHASPPCPSPAARGYPKLCPSSWWSHPTISSSVIPFCSCPQSFPASGSFPMSQLFASGSQTIGASASVLPMNIQGWFPLGLTCFISLQSKRLSRVFSSTIWKYQFFHEGESYRWGLCVCVCVCVCVYNVILLSHKKEWSLAICNNMDGPRGLC